MSCYENLGLEIKNPSMITCLYLLLKNEEDPEPTSQNTMYFDFPRLLIILTINCYSNLQEKLQLLVQILLNGKPKFKQEDLEHFFLEIF
jgi:hypothetical protein